jgi:arylsulfatase A-like enzyme
MQKKPNILFFFTDDQRFDTINTLNNPQIHTPNIDSLVKRGTTFTHAHIPGGSCPAVCMPSRAMLHSGRSLFHIEGEGQNIPAKHTTLGECLQSAGYNTFGTGKWHNGRDSYARSFTGGDEIFFGGMGDHWNVPAYHFDSSGLYQNRCPYIDDPFFSNTLKFRECDHITAGKHSTDLFAEASIQFLKKQQHNKPFFMYVSLMAPHDPRTTPQKYLNMYNPDDIKIPENFMPKHPIDTGALKIRDEMLAAFPRNPKEIKRHISEYYAMISHLDYALGQLLNTLKEMGEMENTIIIFSGDNGLALGQHGLMGKQNLYDHSVRVPLIFAGPGIPQGYQPDNLVYLFDIYPTLCELTGIPIPSSVEGKSLLPCFAKQNYKKRSFLYLSYADSIRGVSDGNYKLIEYASGATQLFDLQNDTFEKNNLTNSDSEILQSMRRQLLRLSLEWDDKKHPTGQKFWAARNDLDTDAA